LTTAISGSAASRGEVAVGDPKDRRVNTIGFFEARISGRRQQHAFDLVSAITGEVAEHLRRTQSATGT